MNETLKKSRIERVSRPAWALEAQLYVPVKDVEVPFAFPAFGPNTYNAVVNQVLDNKQSLPTGEQSAFMLDEAYNPTNSEGKDGKEVTFVRNSIMRDRYLWVPSVAVWTPRDIKNSGMYAVFDENGQGLARTYTNEELEDRLSGGLTERGVRFSQDRTVAFAPRNTITAGNHNKGTLAQDGAFIATYGVEGAEKLDNVANKFALKPYSWIVDNDSNQNIQRLSALGRSLGGGRLYSVFDANVVSRDGCVVSIALAPKT